MKRYMTVAAVCGCLLIGSFYPKLILDHHVKLIDANGEEIVEETADPWDIPVKIEFRFLRFFHK